MLIPTADADRLRLGAALALVGAVGMLVVPTYGLGLLGRPWSFALGFLVGVSAGCGTALCISGLIGLRLEAAGRSWPGNRKDVSDR